MMLKTSGYMLLVLLATSYIQENEEERKFEPLPLESSQKLEFTTKEGTWISLDISPDGKTIVFELLGDLYLLPIGGGKAERITSGFAYDSMPRFSPGGTKILFISDRDGDDNIWAIKADKKADDKTEPSYENGLWQVSRTRAKWYKSPEWDPLGEFIIVTQNDKLMLFHMDGGEGVELTQKGGLNGTGAAFGPNPQDIYFSGSNAVRPWNYNMMDFNNQIYRFDRATGMPHRFTNEYGGAVRPALSPDGRWLVYGTRHDSKTGLRLIDLKNEEIKWLAYPIVRDDQESRFTRDFLPGYSFTPDSNAIVISTGGKIYRIDVPSGEMRAIPFEADVELDLGARAHFKSRVEDRDIQIRQIRWPSLSPDGTKMVFTSLHRLYVRDMQSGELTRVAEMDALQQMPSWGPDSKWIVFTTWSLSSGGDLYKVKAEGGYPIKVSDIKAYYLNPCWSLDGEKVFVVRGPWQHVPRMWWGFWGLGKPPLDLVSFPSGGGAGSILTMSRGTAPHFADDPDRIYMYEGGFLIQGETSMLTSVKLDGTDRREHLEIKMKIEDIIYEGPVHPETLMISPDGESTIATFNNHVYIIPLPRRGSRLEVLLEKPDKTPLPYKKLSDVGANFTRWGKGGKKVTWSLGNTFFIYDLEAARRTRAEGKDYAATQIEVNLTTDRYKGRGVIVLRGGTVITMDGERRGDGVIEDGAVVIEDDRIIRVGKSSEIETPEDAYEVDTSGRFILPGFVDTHAHIWPSFDVHHDVVWQYFANLAYGVTTTRDPQTATTDVLTYSDMVEAGSLTGPRVFYTGPGIFGRVDIIKDYEDAKKIVSRYADYYKNNTVKAYVSGNRRQRQLLAKALIERKLTPTTEGALDLRLDLTQIIDGYSGNEHSLPLPQLYDDIVRLVAHTKTFYTPTLLVSYGGPWAENYFYAESDLRKNSKLRRFIPDNVIEQVTRKRPWFHYDEYVFHQHARHCKKIVDEGGRVCVGSHGQLQGLGYHWELWAIQSGGMEEIDALRCATIFGAEAIGYDQDLGSIEEGKLADIIVLDKDPLEDIRNTSSITYVIKGGLFYDADTLDMLWPDQKKQPEAYWKRYAPAEER